MQIQKQSLVQQQRLTLTPQLVQSIKLMGLPFADLRERILEEVERNPALEISSDPLEGRDWTPPRDGFSAPRLSVSSVSARGEVESDEHRDFIEGALARSDTLQEHLLAQLGEIPLPAPVAALSALVIQNLDRDGFHVVPPSELPGGDDPASLEAALDTVRRLDPVGCACSDFRESLAVQARLLRDSGSGAREDPVLAHAIAILERHFSVLEKGRPDALVKALAKIPEAGFTVEAGEAAEILDIIRSLDPFPGRLFDSSPAPYVVPDVLVRKDADGFVAVINDEVIPVLGISPFFMELEDAGGQSGGRSGDAGSVRADSGESPEKKARDFARESLKEARWFMNSLERRNLTILKVTRALLVYQRDFFLYGPSRLAPLRMKDIAAETGMHEATVSRAANGKYLQCEWGLFEIRHFFSNQVGSSASARAPAPAAGSPAYLSNRFSKEGVKEVIREIVAGSKGNLSDQKIADELALRGIKIARRTVAKYRSELDIGSSFDR